MKAQFIVKILTAFFHEYAKLILPLNRLFDAHAVNALINRQLN